MIHTKWKKKNIGWELRTDLADKRWSVIKISPSLKTHPWRMTIGVARWTAHKPLESIVSLQWLQAPGAPCSRLSGPRMFPAPLPELQHLQTASSSLFLEIIWSLWEIFSNVLSAYNIITFFRFLFCSLLASLCLAALYAFNPRRKCSWRTAPNRCPSTNTIPPTRWLNTSLFWHRQMNMFSCW